MGSALKSVLPVLARVAVCPTRLETISFQYNLQSESKLTITTKRRHLSTEPSDEKGLRLKYAVLTNLWLLAQRRQPGRTFCQDLDRSTFSDFLDTLLDRDNFNFYKEDGRALISPCWSFCLSYEFELRKESICLCKEQSFRIQAALWSALKNQEHRIEHWLQLVAIPNSNLAFQSATTACW